MAHSILHLVCITATILHFVYSIARTINVNFFHSLCACWKSGPRSFIRWVCLVHTLVILCFSLYITAGVMSTFYQAVTCTSHTLILHSYCVLNILYLVSLPQAFVRMSVSCLLCLRSWIIQTYLNFVNIGIFLGHLNRKRACGTMIVICLGTICATGLGFCLVVVLSALPRHVLKVFIDFECEATLIPYMKYGGNDKTDSGTTRHALCDLSNQKRSKQCAAIGNKRPIDSSKCDIDIDPPPPPKRGRKTKDVKDSHHCGSCSIWLQTGSNMALEKHHNMCGRTRHPNEHAYDFTLFASMNGKYQINLRPDNCICDACYRDCKRGESKPRWYKLSERLISKHCMLCCSGNQSCTCVDITNWGSSSWCDGENLPQLVNYLILNGHSVCTASGAELCKSHYVLIRKILSERECFMCKCNESSSWFLCREMSHLDMHESNEWMCCKCNKEISLPSSGFHESKYAKQRSEGLSIAVNQIEQNIGCIIDDVLELYKHSLISTCDINDIDLHREVALFRRWVTSRLKELKYNYFSVDKKNVYTMFFDGSIIQGRGVKCLYNTLKKLSDSHTQCNRDEYLEELRVMVKKQCRAFPKSQEFDFRSIFVEDVSENAFDKYFDPELLHVLSTITTSDRAARGPSI